MAGKIFHAAVVGATTLLGKELLEQISNSAAAAWDLKLLEEGDDVEGQLTTAGEEALVMHTLNEAAFAGLDVVFFAGTPESTAKYLKAAMTAEAAVVDLTAMSQQGAGFLTRSPWLQSEPRPDLTTAGMIVPHPVALMLATVAQRLQQRFGHVEIAATVLEPASQAGSAGVDEMHQQTVSLLSFQEVPKAVFGTQVAFNLQGSLGEESQVRLEDVRSRIRQDLQHVLGEAFDGKISFTLLQAPVFHGYMVSASLRLDSDIPASDLRAAISGGIVVAEADTAPSNQAATEAGDLLVSVQKSPEDVSAGWLLMAADNLQITARSAVQSALELASLRPGLRVQ